MLINSQKTFEATLNTCNECNGFGKNFSHIPNSSKSFPPCKFCGGTGFVQGESKTIQRSKTIYEQAVAKFGADHQILKAVEELNELATALMHYRQGKATNQQVMNEIADVQILLEQLELIFQMESAPFVHEKLKKLENLLK